MEKPMFNVVLVEPEIPQNTGNIGRLCVGSGCHLHLVRPLGFSLEDRYMKRAGLDYWQHLAWTVHDSFESYVNTMQPERLFLFSKKARRVYWEADFRRGDSLVFGKETRGLSRELLTQYSESTLTIPMMGPTRSINLSNSVAIAVYEGLRQLHA